MELAFENHTEQKHSRVQRDAVMAHRANHLRVIKLEDFVVVALPFQQCLMEL